MITRETVKKFNVSGPRYTSYPTAPEWQNQFDEKTYISKLNQLGQFNKSISLYIHIPFCRSMCTFCGCNVVIRPNEPKYADQYLEYLFKEIELVSKYLNRKMNMKQLHLGGGTPTFLTEEQLERLMLKIQNHFDVDFSSEIAIEIDPRTIDMNKLSLLKKIGFNRISMGVQDFNYEVQEMINRIQPFDLVEKSVNKCRELGFSSVNFDLIYGLPKQTKNSFVKTVNQVIKLRPDRIALYSFAYVPWLKKHQNKINTEQLPNDDEKLSIFLSAQEIFTQNGYEAIAMDHFALENDELCKSYKNNKLYRNFMGYTVKPADEYIGVGLTSIGFLEDTYIQNLKTINDYYASLDKGQLPVERGKVLTSDDVIRKWVINELMCHFKVDKDEFFSKFNEEFDIYFKSEQDHINQCVTDNLLISENRLLSVTNLGKIFIRNICMGFDWYLRQKTAHRKFSKTI